MNRRKNSLRVLIRHTAAALAALVLVTSAWADDASYANALDVFRGAGESGTFFDSAYGYAVFPTVGKGGIGVGAATGKGRVYEQGTHIGNTRLTQLSVGFQLGGEAFSQIIFFKDKRALEEFTQGSFEFGAKASAVAITAGVSAGTSTTGNSAGVSGGQHDASTVGAYHKGMAVFTVAKGGLMYAAAVEGQKFSYDPI
jgi:lipid-binding SYLF domain-containing protein